MSIPVELPLMIKRLIQSESERPTFPGWEGWVSPESEGRIKDLRYSSHHQFNRYELLEIMARKP